MCNGSKLFSLQGNIASKFAATKYNANRWLAAMDKIARYVVYIISSINMIQESDKLAYNLA